MFLLLLAVLCVQGWNVAVTPPMGWNSWNYFGCGVDAEVLMDIAKSFIRNDLDKVGYEYVNSDDCWMLAQRSAAGNQIPNPQKFPNGFKAVATFIHSLGLKSGLYTAKGPNTCAGFAASCDHEYIDAKQWADWGIDYVKDDSCSSCGSKSDNDLYGTMWKAIEASGRPMVLTVEGNPDDSLITHGGYGNAKRVGHDITARWLSMVSLIDIASGLWPYAHNSTNPKYGGWWNDLDMIEVGNGPDFLCDTPESLRRCQAHMTMWCIMKAPLILGGDLRALNKDSPVIKVVAHKEALDVNQDPWGIQAKRVSIQRPKNTSLATLLDNNLVIAPCDSSRKTQKWFWKTPSVPRTNLYIQPCNSSDPYQQWSFVGGQLKNVRENLCVDSAGQKDPAKLEPCNGKSVSQQWTLESSGHIQNTPAAKVNYCLDVYDFSGPDVQIYPCKTPGQGDSNQVWSLRNGMLRPQSSSNQCLSAGASSSGGVLTTIDDDGVSRCISNLFGSEGGWAGVDCNQQGIKPNYFIATPVGPPRSGIANYSLNSVGGSPHWNNQQGASGPWPGTRYIAGYSWDSSSAIYELDLEAAKTSAGTSITASDHHGIINDPLIGKITRGGNFCLDLVSGGMLEVWSAALSGGRVSVALFNRSPADDIITLNWSDIGISGVYQVRDVWESSNKGRFQNVYATTVYAHSTVFLVLSPA